MKMRFNLFVFLIMFLFFVSSISAHQIPNYTDKYVNDFVGILSSEQVSDLRILFESVDKDTTAEVVFVSVESAGEHTPQQYATEILNEWKVGKSDKDNGLVMLYSKQEKKFWIATGYGLEGILPDSKIGRLLDENYVPLRDRENVIEGIVAFANEIAKVIEDNKDEIISGKAGKNDNFFFVFFLVLLSIIGIGIILYKIASIKKLNSKIYKDITISQYGNTTKDSNKKYQNFFSSLAFIIMLIGIFIGNLTMMFLGISLIFLSNLIPKKCSKDGERLKFWKEDSKHKYYRCSRGHILSISLVAAAGGLAGSGFGGSSSGFGGGGFGGGGGGGGGAGR